MAIPSLSQASLFQPKSSLLNPNTLQNQNANSRLFAHHNHLSITLPLKTRNGLVLYPKASLTVQPNVNSTTAQLSSSTSTTVSPTTSARKWFFWRKHFLLVPPIYEQYMGEVGCYFEVYRNEEITVDELKRMNPRGILISPGPGVPQDSGISLQTVLELGPIVPLFGVCMGLQCTGEAFGGKVVRSPSGVMHGKSSLVYYDEKQEDNLFAGLSNPFTAGRYHSLVIEKESFPGDELEITAWTEDGCSSQKI